jgi:hypothetical protein
MPIPTRARTSALRGYVTGHGVVVVGIDAPQRAHLAMEVLQSLFRYPVLHNLRYPTRPDRRETKHDLHDFTAQRVRNRRAARARQGPER